MYQARRHLDFYQWFFSRRIDIFCMKVVYLTTAKDWVQSMRVHSECLAAECLIQNYQIQRGCMFIKDFLSSHTYDKQVLLCQTHCHTSLKKYSIHGRYNVTFTTSSISPFNYMVTPVAFSKVIIRRSTGVPWYFPQKERLCRPKCFQFTHRF